MMNVGSKKPSIIVLTLTYSHLILGGVLLMMGFIAYLAGLVADLISFNRQLLEMTLEKIRRTEIEKHRGVEKHEGPN